MHHEDVDYSNVHKLVEGGARGIAVGDGNYSKAILVGVPLKGEGGKGTWTLCLAWEKKRMKRSKKGLT